MYRTVSMSVKSFVLLVVAASLLAGCSTSQITGSWSDPGLTSDGFQHILIIGIANSDMVKRTYEDMMVARFKEKGIQASPSYRFMPANEKVEREVILSYIQKNNVDGVMVTKMIDKRTETVVTPAQTTVRSGNYYGGGYGGGYNSYYPHYSASYDVTHSPSTIQSYDVLTIESTLYKIQDEKEQPAWSAQSETAPGGNLNEDLSELADKLIKDMSGQGLF